MIRGDAVAGEHEGDLRVPFCFRMAKSVNMFAIGPLPGRTEVNRIPRNCFCGILLALAWL